MTSTTTVTTKYWHAIDDGRIQCDLCPRACKLREGQQGLCFVRARQNNQIVLTTYGRSSGFVIDPIEKKPLNHFYPGSAVLSFGTAGCNLACRFCQNWDISKSRHMDTLMEQADPEQLALTAAKTGCRSIAFTYNDPVIFHEYAIDVAQACYEQGIQSVAVTAGYINPTPRIEFFNHMQAANVDLKAFSEDFYWRLTGAHLQHVLETIAYIYHETKVWLELTTLLIPDHNDSYAEITALCRWVRDNLGAKVPIHFTAFHPDYKMQHVVATPIHSLHQACSIAREHELQYVYMGNVRNTADSNTFCANCQNLIIERNGYQLGDWGLQNQGHCKFCGTVCPGRFDNIPGHWGAQRVQVKPI